MRNVPRFRAGIAVAALGFWALVGPTLVICQGSEGHTAVESAMAPCCERGDGGHHESREVRTAATSAPRGCADDCSDTPLLTSFELSKPQRVAVHFATTIEPLTVPACHEPSPATADGGRAPAPSPMNLGQFIVLRT